jgi:argininosuccinate lyase
MFSRDRERLDEVWRRVNVMPLGAADLSGTFIELDREEIAAALGFEGISANSLDASADADFAVETSGACSLVMIHLSRLAEDLILYNSDEFGFFDSAGAASIFPFVSARESMFEVLELVRGKAGRVFGHQTALVSTVKSLSLGVHKDLQEIKEAIFDTIDTMQLCLSIASTVLESLRVNETKTLDAVGQDSLNAGELTDYLIQRGVSSKAAKQTAGEIVSYAVSQGKKINELSLENFQTFSGMIAEDVFRALTLEQTLASKNQIGGTSPERVHEALELARQNLEREIADV